jgi:type IV fimbrial biogenesis protein FimT
MMRKDGFTLIEALVTIVILGVLAVIAVPRFSLWMPDMRLRSAVRDLKSDMELAKLKAIRENAFVAVTFNLGANSYTAFVDDGEGGGVANDLTLNGSEEVLTTVILPSDVTMYEASFSLLGARCHFNSRGLTGGSAGHVYMRNTNNNYRGISLNTVGRVQVQSSTDGGTWVPAE